MVHNLTKGLRTISVIVDIQIGIIFLINVVAKIGRLFLKAATQYYRPKIMQPVCGRQ